MVQTESFDPNTGDVTLTVPAHGNNVAVTVLIAGPSNARSKSFGMVTSFDDYCLVGEPPSDFSNSAYSSPDDSDEFTNSTNKSHHLNIIGSDLTEQEKSSLPESFLAVCKDKPIKNVTKVVVDEEGFDDETYDSVVGRSRHSRALPRDNSCSNEKVKEYYKEINTINNIF